MVTIGEFSFISADTTRLTCYKIGKGEGIILVHGGVEVAKSHIELAKVLSEHFTIYFYDRRGRGKSDKYDLNNYTIQKEVEDLESLIRVTDTRYVFGISSGALIVLRTLLHNKQIEKAVIYEPPLSINGSYKLDWLDTYYKQLEKGKIDDALITGMLGAQMGPPIFYKMPAWLLKLLLSSVNEKPDKNTGASMKELSPTLAFDIKLVLELVDTIQQFANIKQKILLLSGDQSPEYLKYAINQLEKILRDSNKIILRKTAHGGSGNKNQGGKPELVGRIMIDFYNEINKRKLRTTACIIHCWSWVCVCWFYWLPCAT